MCVSWENSKNLQRAILCFLYEYVEVTTKLIIWLFMMKDINLSPPNRCPRVPFTGILTYANPQTPLPPDVWTNDNQR